MNLISIIVLLLPISLTIYVLLLLAKRSQLWLEVFAGMVSLMIFSYSVIFWLGTKEVWLLSLGGSIAIIQFLGLLIFPMTSGDHYLHLPFKSLLADGQSSFAQKIRSIQSSRLSSSIVVFLFFLVGFGLVFYSTGLIENMKQTLWLVGLSTLIALKNALDWKPSKV